MSFADKIRYSYDGLRTQRLVEPMIRVDGVFETVSWKKALRAVAEKLQSVSAVVLLSYKTPLIMLLSRLSL